MKLKTARETARLSQSDLAARVGCDKGTICRLEKEPGRFLLSPYSLIVNICRTLGYEPSRLFPVPRTRDTYAHRTSSPKTTETPA